MHGMKIVVLVALLCRWSVGWTTDPNCAPPVGPQPTQAQTQALETWIKMLGRMQISGASLLAKVDADLVGEEQFRTLCRLSEDPDQELCRSRLPGDGKSAVLAGHGLLAAMGYEESRYWLAQAASRPSSRLLAGTLQVAIGVQDVSGFLWRHPTPMR